MFYGSHANFQHLSKQFPGKIYVPTRKQNSNLHVISCMKKNKANLGDLIAATGLVIVLKLDSKNWFFSLYDPEIR